MKNTTIRPLPGYCLIEPIEEEEKSAGGIYMPESVKDKPSKGRVISSSDMFIFQGNIVGPENKNLRDSYFPIVGKTVIYKKWTNQEVQHKGKEYLLVKFEELLAIIE